MSMFLSCGEMYLLKAINYSPVNRMVSPQGCIVCVCGEKIYRSVGVTLCDIFMFLSCGEMYLLKAINHSPVNRMVSPQGCIVCVCGEKIYRAVGVTLCDICFCLVETCIY